MEDKKNNQKYFLVRNISRTGSMGVGCRVGA
jgi:hypothetical protein